MRKEAVKQMEQIGYETDVHISYFQVDAKGKMTLAALLAMLQEMAILHSAQLGFTVEYLQEKQRGWVLLNWHLLLKRMPEQGETIHVETWSDKCRRLQAERSFRIVDQAGTEILLGKSRWIYMDLEKRHPDMIPEDMISAYLSNQKPAIADEHFSLPTVAEGEVPFSVMEVKVTRRDVDTNGHANNIKYFEWVMDDVPDVIYDGMQLTEIMAFYRKECYRGDVVRVETYIRQQEGGKEVISLLKDHVQGHAIAQIVTRWQ